MSVDSVEDETTTTPGTTTAKRVRKPRKPTLDAAAAGAVDLARAAAEEVADEGTVGEHLGTVPEGDRIVSHTFACLLPGYRGWRWTVTVTRASRARNVTVSEVCLLPGDDALQPPVWLPWAERLAPGDVGPQDTLPRKADDPLLEPGFEETGDEDLDRVALHELGLGRERVLSPLGRDEAATRWYEGDRGPRTEIAENAKAQCSTCGFFLALAGSLRQVFGACANEWSPEDGRVVSVDHGCGAHSETDVEVTPDEPSVTVVDDLSSDAFEVVETASLVDDSSSSTLETVAGDDATQTDTQTDTVEATS
ncbi:DUF3027 domain-containing protein [Kineococcus endophyticus]|uniref:DUF3027 domain-containing protein n=1 Tax=Kineococcus endophyticus TaxID=1181883 RepID=UPI003F59D3DC